MSVLVVLWGRVGCWVEVSTLGVGVRLAEECGETAWSVPVEPGMKRLVE